MIELGKVQKMEVIRDTKIGVYLNSKDDSNDEDVLLPKNQVPQDIEVGDEIEVFIYRDSEDRIISTVRTPKLTIGKLAFLRVVEINKIGAFLDWGLEKDLFLPYKEQRGEIKKDSEYLVGLYVDRSDRLSATMDIYKLLSTDCPYKENERVKGTIYTINQDFGAFVAVYDKYHGLIPNKEFYGNYKIGDTIEGRIKKIRSDGKLELSLRSEAHFEIGDDAEKILSKMKKNGGRLSLNDNSNPDVIKAQLSMSKAAFKRAVGRLLKQGKIKITEKGIEMI
jgi:uncharacterized protein